MKQGMTNVDVAALSAELAPLVVGTRVDRVYQPAKDRILLRFRRKGAPRVDLLFALGRFLTATKRPAANPDKPSMLAQVLRTALENARVTGLRQLGFDRLVRLDMERGDGRRSLVFELFGDGNMLLLDASDVIALPMRGEDYGARRLRKGEPYQQPPGSSLPFALDAAQLKEKAEGKRDLVRFLAVDLGFGPLWGEELCLRTGIAKNTSVADLDEAGWATVQSVIAALGTDIARNDLAPNLVYEFADHTGAIGPRAADAVPQLVDAVPFAMLRYPAPRFSHEQAPTFHEALDSIFVGGPETTEDDEPEDPRRGRYEEAKGKILRQAQQVDEAIEAFDKEAAQARAEGDALFAGFAQVQQILKDLNDARKTRSWAAIEETLAKGRAEGNELAKQVPSLMPHNGTATVAVRLADGTTKPVEVDLRLNVQENADAKYEAVKRARARREGALTARKDAERKLRDLEKKGLDAFGAAPQRPERVSRHFWFEAYRWTLTPSGLVAVGGRNAAQNDQVVKKYLRDGDRYVHAEIHGAPSVVVRPAEGTVKDIPNDDLRAACQFAACTSRAWRQFGPATAYWVTANQVSKTPASGEYVPRGAWMIHGKRNVEPDLPMDWWTGKVRLRANGSPLRRDEAPAAGERIFEKLVGGPKDCVAPFANGMTHMVPGRIEPNDAAQMLCERYGVTNEEAAAVLPAGPVELREEVPPSTPTGAPAAPGAAP